MRGRLAVVAMVAAGAALAVVAAIARERRGATLPLQPGSILLVTCGTGAPGLGPFAADAVAFPNAHGVSSETVASLAALHSGRMPRAAGVAREGDVLRAGVALLAERLHALRFTTAIFSRSRLALRDAGLARGAALVLENGAADAPGAAQQAVRWLEAQGDAPACAWLHVDEWPPDAPSEFLDALHAGPLGARVVVVRVDLARAAAPGLALRVPGGLLTAGEDARDVSLLDVVPTLLELYGIPVAPELMEPFLLAPRTRAPRFFAFGEPLPPPDLDADAVTLVAGDFEYRLDPRATPPEQVRPREGRGGARPLPDDRAELLRELRRVLESGFHWRIDAHGFARWPEGR